MLQYAVLHGVRMVPSVVLYTSDVYSQSYQLLYSEISSLEITFTD